MNFVHIPKTGGSSIASVIGGHTCLHVRASEVQEPRFSFVRHPLDRLVSAYEFMRSSKSSRFREVSDCTIEDFVGRDHPCLQPQVWWLNAPMRFIGKFERLEEDFLQISDKPLPHINKSIRGDWRNYFTPEALRRAVARYADDFLMFNYEIPHVS